MNCYKTVATSKWHSGSLTGRRFEFPMPDAFGKIRQLLAMNRRVVAMKLKPVFIRKYKYHDQKSKSEKQSSQHQQEYGSIIPKWKMYYKIWSKNGLS